VADIAISMPEASGHDWARLITLMANGRRLSRSKPLIVIISHSLMTHFSRRRASQIHDLEVLGNPGKKSRRSAYERGKCAAYGLAGSGRAVRRSGSELGFGGALKEKGLGEPENRAPFELLLTLENELEANQQLTCVAGECRTRIVEVRFVRNEVVFLRRASHAEI
jgi:hypothetical protein